MQSDSDHFTKLENMYRSAPINKIFPPEISIGNGKAEISLKIVNDYHHAANSLHGSVYFKLLDDSAFFAAQSLVNDVFVLTASFTLQLFKPVQKGIIIAKGKVLEISGRKILAESNLYDSENRIIAKGSGTLIKSKIELSEKIGYQ